MASRTICSQPTLLATTAPIVVAPAMNVHMYENAATQTNIETLKSRGFRFIEADDGYLACGDVGRGRLAEPERIVSAVLDVLNGKEEIDNDLAGKRIMVTAGPTVEPLIQSLPHQSLVRQIRLCTGNGSRQPRGPGHLDFRSCCTSGSRWRRNAIR